MKGWKRKREIEVERERKKKESQSGRKIRYRLFHIKLHDRKRCNLIFYQHNSIQKKFYAKK